MKIRYVHMYEARSHGHNLTSGQGPTSFAHVTPNRTRWLFRDLVSASQFNKVESPTAWLGIKPNSGEVAFASFGKPCTCL